jgi:hypothetical protein
LKGYGLTHQNVLLDADGNAPEAAGQQVLLWLRLVLNRCAGRSCRPLI